ncbi:NUDIX hydrolase, partial [Phytoactinopolyspora endophytica]|uniref:NUDIX hydrolase n=1 Tax=Phytoactinopolyspora endophytica TaxID=1642495 RepID=UPI0013EA679A
MTIGRRLPPASAERARAFIAERRTPVPARPASSVLLLRSGADGLEVYVHLRHTSMAFAGGMVAFPGGSVDPADMTPLRHSSEWAARLGTTESSVAGFVNAALRETQEETGVVLEPETLVPLAHWITPRFEERRFDTWFFAAEPPAGQEPRDVSGEASHVTWITPQDAIARAERGEWTMLTVTWAILEDLARYGTVDDVPRTRPVEAVLPGWIDRGDDVLVLIPGDREYPG